MMQHVLGFAFDIDRDGFYRVMLIRKARPAWQCGLFNGIGGKVERFETTLEAMVRECREETGLRIADWTPVVHLSIGDSSVHVFTAFHSLIGAASLTDEQVDIFQAERLGRSRPPRLVPNLHWLIPMAMATWCDPAFGVMGYPTLEMPCERKAA